MKINEIIIIFLVLILILFSDLSVFPSNTPEDAYRAAKNLYELGTDEWNKGNVDEAKKSFRMGFFFLQDALEADPNNPNYLRLSYNFLVAENRLDEALRDVNNVISLEPKNGENYALRAEVFFLLNLREASFADYRKAMKLKPSDFVVPTNYCSALNFIKKYREAIDVCTKAIQINPEHGLAYFLRSKAYKGLGKDDLANKDYKKAKSLGFEEIKDNSVEDNKN